MSVHLVRADGEGHAETSPWGRLTMTAPSRISVLVADDAEDVRAALGELLDGDARFRLVGSAGDAIEAADLALELGPDLAIVDVRMPGGGGEEACRRIRAGSPTTCVIALSAVASPSLQRRMAAAGAAAYLTKGVPGDELLDDLAQIVRGARS